MKLTVLVFLGLFGEVAFSFYCNDGFCAERTMPYNFPCQPVKNCTKIGYRTFLDPDVCNCCEYCFDYLKEDDTCEGQTPTKPTEMCGPHLTCTLGSTYPMTCKKMTSAPNGWEDPDRNFCMARRHDYDEAKKEGELGVAQVYPECDHNGQYAPRQCLPGSICYCSSLDGRRIFGLATPQEYQDCACARDIDRLKEFGFTGRYPHCLPNGDYDELQCVVRACFCRSHPEDLVAMHKLDNLTCFDPKIHVYDPITPLYYMRPCELRRAELEVQIADAELAGRRLIVPDIPDCSPDGNYAPIQSKFNKLFCANNETGEQIENYEATKFSLEAKIMDCHCARDRDLLWNSATGKPKCCSNGSYRPWQCVGTKCFCVDELGRQDMTLLNNQEDEDNIHLLDCYHGTEHGDPDPPCDYSLMQHDEEKFKMKQFIPD